MEEQDAPPPPATGYDPILHGFCLTAVIVCPIGLLLPPRRMSIQNCFLATTLGFATNQLAADWTGRTLYSRAFGRISSMTDVSLPEKARRTRDRLREEKARRATPAQQEEQADAAGARQGSAPSWFGSADKDWARKNLERDKKMLDEGKGYWDIILGDMREAFGLGKEGKQGAKGEGDTKPSASPKK